jgi:hypothetical protein
MFSINSAITTTKETIKEDDILKQTKYKTVIQPTLTNSSFEERNETNMQALDVLLEKEKHTNSTDSWNKLNKTSKIQKLHQFSETYGHEKKLPQKDIKSLKLYFNDCLDKNKLQRTKDLVYDKEKGIIISIPGLLFNTTSRAFTIRSADSLKRVSSLKSLAPKKNKTPTIVIEEEEEEENN